MSKKLLIVAAAAFALAFASGCATVAAPAMGGIVTDMTWDGHTNGSLGSKEGRACATSILGWVAQGDASIAAAAQAGGISNVTTVDHYSKHILVYGEYCTIARGN